MSTSASGLDPFIKGLLSSDPFMVLEQHTLTRPQILSAAYHLSLTLPPNPVVFNLYTRRDSFLVMLLAVAMKGGISILPPNTAENTLIQLFRNALSELGSSVFAVTDPEQPPLLEAHQEVCFKSFDFPSFFASPMVDETTLISAFQKALAGSIWLFTSGTTGKAKRVVKTWQEMKVLAQQAIERFELMQSKYLVATVPSQHMFGLETSIFWPLFSKATVWAERPMFAEDIKSALAMSTHSSMLISTPLHLKKLMQFDLDWERDDLLVLSATAPLAKELARTIQYQMNAMVFEVYGSTETASIASRETLQDDSWSLYEGNRLTFKKESSVYQVCIHPLAQTHSLQDEVELCSEEGAFRLLGRQSDLIKVAGKRGSLMNLNHHLQAVQGVEDGVFWVDGNNERLQALVVSDLTTQQIKQALSKSLDPVFLPRPIYFVERIPRNSLGKIQHQLVKKLIEKGS